MSIKLGTEGAVLS